jgi:surface antigen
MTMQSKSKNFTRLTIAAVASAFLLAGCNTADYSGKQKIGTLLGATGGALAGSQIGSGRGTLVAVALGTALGGLFGNEVGKSLDNADRAAMTQAEYQALDAPVGDPIAWNNPESGNSGQVQTVREGQTSSGAYCREYQHSVSVGGRIQEAYGTACQQPDGSWKVVD